MSLQPINRNVSFLKDRLDVVIEALFLSTNTPVAMFKLAVRHAMEQPAVRHSDNVTQPPVLAMEVHGLY